MNILKSIGLEKAKAHIKFEIIQYLHTAVVIKTIIRKITGNITASSFDAGEKLAEKTSPFYNYIQIINGKAELTIKHKIFRPRKGEGIIMPAHSAYIYNAKQNDIDCDKKRLCSLKLVNNYFSIN